MKLLLIVRRLLRRLTHRRVVYSSRNGNISIAGDEPRWRRRP